MLLFWQEPAGSDSVKPIQVLERADIQQISAEVMSKCGRSWEPSVWRVHSSPWIWAGSGPRFRGDAARTRMTFLLCSWCPGHQQTPLCLLFRLTPGQLRPVRCPSAEEQQAKGDSLGPVEGAVAVTLLSKARAEELCRRVIGKSEVGVTHSQCFLQPKSKSGNPLFSCW